jgi:hypothetical protein
MEDDPPSEEVFSARVRELRELVARIQVRGGRVAIIRLPTPELWAMEEEVFPRSRFWDRMAREAGCLTLHFRDVPELASVHLPDTSHLDYRDAPAFTRALLEALTKAGFFQGAAGNPTGDIPQSMGAGPAPESTISP